MIPRRVGLTPGNMDPATAVLPQALQPEAAPPQVELGAAFNIEGQEPVEQPTGPHFVLRPPAPSPVVFTPPAPALTAAPGRINPADILAQLQQMRTVLKENTAVASTVREFVITRGMAVRVEGCILLTPKGVSYLADFGLL